jgi:hypothetical protein
MYVLPGPCFASQIIRCRWSTQGRNLCVNSSRRPEDSPSPSRGCAEGADARRKVLNAFRTKSARAPSLGGPKLVQNVAESSGPGVCATGHMSSTDHVLVTASSAYFRGSNDPPPQLHRSAEWTLFNEDSRDQSIPHEIGIGSLSQRAQNSFERSPNFRATHERHSRCSPQGRCISRENTSDRSALLDVRGTLPSDSLSLGLIIRTRTAYVLSGTTVYTAGHMISKDHA